MMKFTWVDCETGDKVENLFGANGQNDWEKGLGSALTYGERYFLLKYFHIATDEDDIDNPDRKKIDTTPMPQEPQTQAKDELTKANNKVWQGAIKALKEGKGIEAIKQHYALSAENEKLLIDESK